MDFSFKNFVINTYDDIKPYMDELLARELHTKEETLKRFSDMDALRTQIYEDFARREIRNTCNTADEELEKRYMYFIQEISPKLAEVDDLMNKKMIASPGIEEIEADEEAYMLILRGVRKDIDMFREENIALDTTIAEKAKEFGKTAGAMSIEYDGKTLTMQQGQKYLEAIDETVRKEVYEKIWTRRTQDQDMFDNLLTELIQLRTTLAKNAGYPSFVEYKWDSLHRFDYTQQDVFSFHAGIKEHIVPLLQKIYDEKKEKLGVATLKPYNLLVDESLETPLKPFEGSEELVTKAIQSLTEVSPEFGAVLKKMDEMKHLDLESRKNKRPGGYMCPLPVSRYPFIFMNSANTQGDLKTLFHESGHAMHDVLCSRLPNMFTNYPMEMAEVASMSMELISMGKWGHFYNDHDLQRAKLRQLENLLDVLPRISIIDSFQYRLYKNPTHTIEERDAKFSELLETYEPWIDRSDYKHFEKKRRQPQMHIFEIPFYYIEYGIAQLASLGIRKNYMTNPQEGLEKYKAALSLGYSKKLPTLYETAGISFDFSPARIKELADFVRAEREKLTK